MKINRENYEVFFVDYLDGKLSDAQIHEFEAFLFKNQDLREELEGMEQIRMLPDEEKFSFKENLFQIDLSFPINDENFDFYCIAESEGDLSAEQINYLDEFVERNPNKSILREGYKKLKVEADQNHVFSNKDQLKKSVFVFTSRMLYQTVAIAASIAILVIVFTNPGRNADQEIIVSDNTILTETNDTIGYDPANDTDLPEENENKVKSIIPVKKENVRNAVRTISIKVGIPIASNETQTEIVEETIPAPVLYSHINLEEKIFHNSPVSSIKNDVIDPSKINTGTQYTTSDDNAEYLRLDEFARQRLSELVFKEKETNLNLWNLASAGIDKLSDVTGTNMKLQTTSDEEGTPRKLSFNSKLLSFSTPINRED